MLLVVLAEVHDETVLGRLCAVAVGQPSVVVPVVVRVGQVLVLLRVAPLPVVEERGPGYPFHADMGPPPLVPRIQMSRPGQENIVKEGAARGLSDIRGAVQGG